MSDGAKEFVTETYPQVGRVNQSVEGSEGPTLQVQEVRVMSAKVNLELSADKQQIADLYGYKQRMEKLQRDAEKTGTKKEQYPNGTTPIKYQNGNLRMSDKPIGTDGKIVELPGGVEIGVYNLNSSSVYKAAIEVPVIDKDNVEFKKHTNIHGEPFRLLTIPGGNTVQINTDDFVSNYDRERGSVIIRTRNPDQLGIIDSNWKFIELPFESKPETDIPGFLNMHEIEP